MTAFLLIWNPEKWPWPEQPGMAARVARGETVPDTWGCGVSRSLRPGDRLFVHRVGKGPRGLFASGYVTRAPYEVSDPRSKRGYRLCIDLTYDVLADAAAPLVARDELRAWPYSVQLWDAQGSGISIKPPVEAALEKLWAQRTRPVAPEKGAIR